jgi:Putative metallopeptidase
MILKAMAFVASIFLPSIAIAQSAAPTTPTVTQTNRVKIEYVPPTNPAHQPLLDLLKRRHMLERVQTLLSPFRLPRDLLIRVKGCDVVNAWYEQGVVTVCYEYLDFVEKNTPKETSHAGVTPEDALVGQTYYVFMHEVGHAMFALFEAPVFGGEEQAADQFSTYMMLQLGKNEAFPLIMGATYTFQSFLRKPEIIASIQSFSDIHGTPAQRYFNLMCIGYGARPDVFAEVITNHYLPQGRAQDCSFEYGALAWAYDHLILPHVDQELARNVLDRSWIPTITSRPERPGHPPQL